MGARRCAWYRRALHWLLRQSDHRVLAQQPPSSPREQLADLETAAYLYPGHWDCACGAPVYRVERRARLDEMARASAMRLGKHNR